MSVESVFAFGRVIERLLISFSGAMALVMGWHLFRVGVVTQQTAELAVRGWKMQLQKVGPGVFFALFGSAILIANLYSPLEREPDREGEGYTVSYLAQGPQQRGCRLSLAINTLVSLDTAQIEVLTDLQRQAIRQAQERLASFRTSLVQEEFDVEQLPEKIRTFRDSPDRLSEEERRVIESADLWLRGKIGTDEC